MSFNKRRNKCPISSEFNVKFAIPSQSAPPVIARLCRSQRLALRDSLMPKQLVGVCNFRLGVIRPFVKQRPAKSTSTISKGAGATKLTSTNSFKTTPWRKHGSKPVNPATPSSSNLCPMVPSSSPFKSEPPLENDHDHRLQGRKDAPGSYWLRRQRLPTRHRKTSPSSRRTTQRTAQARIRDAAAKRSNSPSILRRPICPMIPVFPPQTPNVLCFFWSKAFTTSSS